MPGFSQWDVGACCCPEVQCPHTFELYGCNSNPYPGIIVTLYDAITGANLASGTTGANGQLILQLPDGSLPYSVGISGQSPRFNPYRQTLSLSCGATTSIALATAPGYICGGPPRCLLPLPLTLNATVFAPFDPNFVPISGTATYDPIFFGWVFNEGGFQYIFNHGMGSVQVGTVFYGPICNVSFASTTCPPAFTGTTVADPACPFGFTISE
jgi:hypothetical protein